MAQRDPRDGWVTRRSDSERLCEMPYGADLRGANLTYGPRKWPDLYGVDLRDAILTRRPRDRFILLDHEEED